MASEASSFIERLIAMPFFTAFTSAAPESTSNHDSENPDHESTIRRSIDRIILINLVMQGMMVIGGSATDFDSVLDDLMRKEGHPPASQASIDGMAVMEVKGTDEIESLGGECVICLEEWRVGDVAKEMPCKHKFHGGCLDTWLQIHGSCPLCRHKMPVSDDSDKKIGDESGRRRRGIWVTLAFGNGRSSSEAESLNQESSVESDES
ncbi:hypothetical protein SSX86_020835 [Deinandra increscens subsp. villosa]|uniref:RING-type E3 ubiquitin transferase n=1 Tax=Deinandra increscens subsp. villosa TaxID=3103831 RepID=A0AAP0CNM2_9ASTR